jgi:long-chain acyl-CoA synthetase
LGEVPHVAELAVVGVDLGGVERVACLAVVAQNGKAGQSEEEARSALRAAVERLPMAQRPAFVELGLEPLPRTATRKVKRDEVRATLTRLLAARSTTGEARESGVRTAIAKVQGVPAEGLSGASSLAGDLAFDSLMLTELHEVLEARFGPVDPERLRACATVGDIESLVSDAPRDPALGAPAVAPSPSVSLPEPVQEMGRHLVGKLQDVFYGEVMKAAVFGRTHIPHNRNVLVVANHASHLDMGLVRHALGEYGADVVSLAAQDYFFDRGAKRAFFENLTNLHAIDRHASLRQTVRQVGDLIERGKRVLIFPEGTRSSTGLVGDFKSLVGYLALTHGVDVLPVFVGGTHAAMPKGARLPTKRDVFARIGPVLAAADLARLTRGLSVREAAREVARMAREAVVALADGKVLDLSTARGPEDLAPSAPHPMITLFGELESKFRAGEVEKPVSYYVSLGSDDLAKWTVRVDAKGCAVRPGKPEGGQADCVLKTSPEIFTKIVREAYVPSPADFLSGAFKSNDVSLLMTFQKVFQLDSGAS